MNREDAIQELKANIHRLQFKLEDDLDNLNKEEVRVLIHKIERLCEDYKLRCDIEKIKNEILTTRNNMVTKAKPISDVFNSAIYDVDRDITSLDYLDEGLSNVTHISTYNYEEVMSEKILEQIRNLNRQNYFYNRDMFEIKRLLDRIIEQEAGEYRAEVNMCCNNSKRNLEEIKMSILNECPMLKQELLDREEAKRKIESDFIL